MNEEECEAGKVAAEITLNIFVRFLVLNGPDPRRRTQGLSPVKDHQLLGQLLGQLGASQLSKNLKAFAEAC